MAGRRANGEDSFRLLASGRMQGRRSLGRDPATGRYVRLTVTTQRTLDDARESELRREARRLLDAAEEGSRSPNLVTTRGSMTVASYLTWWLEGPAQRDYKPSTLRNLTVDINKLRAHFRGPLALEDLRREHVDAFMESQLRAGYSPGYVNRMRASFAAAIRYAVEEEWLASNPVRRAKPAREEPSQIERFSAEDVERILKAARDLPSHPPLPNGAPHPMWALFYLAFRCGLRRAELFGLTWSDVDLGGRDPQIRVWRQLGRDGFVTTKTARQRTLPITHDTIMVLDEHRRWHDVGTVDVGGLEAALVFTTRSGSPLTATSGFEPTWYRVLENAGAPRLPFKASRATCLSMLADSGVSQLQLQHLAGHASARTTEKYYTRVSGDALRRVTEVRPW